MIQGLYHQLADMARQAEAKRVISDDPASAPFIGYSAFEDAARIDREMVPMGVAIAESEEAVRILQGVLNLLGASTHKSRHRSLVISYLEAAQDRLGRELGDKPA